MATAPVVRIFISSPGDVGEERSIAGQVIDRLLKEYLGRLRVEPVFWEHEPLGAHAGFQDQIPMPSQSDIVISILWSRLGTRLAPHFKLPGDDQPPTGTEFEILDALRAFKEHGRPTMLIYRKSAPVRIASDDPQAEERLRQKGMLDQFLTRLTTKGGALTAATHAFATADAFGALLEQHLRRLLAKLAGSNAVPAKTWEDGSPFRGLQAFDSQHAGIFFGRRKATAEILQALRAQAAQGLAALIVAGMSGSGKSSVVRAGVLPLLTRPGVIEGVAAWRTAVMKPSDPAPSLGEVLAQALLTALPEITTTGLDPRRLGAVLASDPTQALASLGQALDALGTQVQQQRSLSTRPEVRLLLVIDQFEELFTVAGITTVQRAAFIAALAALAASRRVWVLATLRSDFLHRCVEVAGLADLINGSGTYQLQAPTSSELEDIIRQPAFAAGLTFEEQGGKGLDRHILDEATGHPDCLPLLEFTLDQLWHEKFRLDKRVSNDSALTFADYRRIGGIVGALATHADHCLERVAPEAQAAFTAVAERLVAVDQGQAVRRWVSRRDVDGCHPGAPILVEALIANRLLLADGSGDSGRVSIAHESMLQHWHRLSDHVAANRAFLMVRERLEDEAQHWRAAQSSKRDDLLLPSGLRLEEGRLWLRTRPDGFNQQTREFIEVSDRREWTLARRRRNLVIAGAVSAVAIIILLGSALTGEQAALRRAEHEKQNAEHALAGEKAAVGRAEQAEREAKKSEKDAKKSEKDAVDALAGERRALLQSKQNENEAISARNEAEGAKKKAEAALAGEQAALHQAKQKADEAESAKKEAVSAEKKTRDLLNKSVALIFTQLQMVNGFVGKRSALITEGKVDDASATKPLDDAVLHLVKTALKDIESYFHNDLLMFLPRDDVLPMLAFSALGKANLAAQTGDPAAALRIYNEQSAAIPQFRALNDEQRNALLVTFMKIPVVIESLKSLEETKDGATVVAKLTSVLMQARKRSVSHLVEAQQMADNLAIIAGGKADVMLARQQANADQSSDTNNSICWFSLLAKRLPVALTHGQAAVAANGENRTAWGNLAHAKLLLGQEREAMAIYRKFKGQDLRPGISWLQATADDLALLAELGYPRDPMNRVLADLGLPRLVGWP